MRYIMGLRNLSTVSCYLTGFLVAACFVNEATAGDVPEVIAPDRSLTWVHNSTTARRLAQDNAKLLLLVHFADDFSKEGLSSDTARTYHVALQSTFRSSPTLARNFVVASQNVGPAESFQDSTSQPKVSTKQNKSKQKRFPPITYFTTPNGEILHFVVGSPSSTKLKAASKWSLELWQSLAKSIDNEDRRAAVRSAHLETVSAELLKLFMAEGGPDLKERRPNGLVLRRDVWQVVESAARTRRELLTRRFAPNFRPTHWPAVLEAIQSSADIGPDLAHLPLAFFPLVGLERIQQPVFRYFVGKPFTRRSRRTSDFVAALKANRTVGRPTLLVIQPDSRRSPETDSTALLKNSAVRRELAHFERIDLVKDEMASIVSELHLLFKKPSFDGPPLIVLVDKTGRLAGVYSGQMPSSRFARLLRKTRDVNVEGDDSVKKQTQVIQ